MQIDRSTERFVVNRRLSRWEDHGLSRYRYRTAALTGPWREDRRAAMVDAAKAKQAMLDEKDADSIRWIVPGKIEEMGEVPARAARP